MAQKLIDSRPLPPLTGHNKLIDCQAHLSKSSNQQLRKGKSSRSPPHAQPGIIPWDVRRSYLQFPTNKAEQTNESDNHNNPNHPGLGIFGDLAILVALACHHVLDTLSIRYHPVFLEKVTNLCELDIDLSTGSIVSCSEKIRSSLCFL